MTAEGGNLHRRPAPGIFREAAVADEHHLPAIRRVRPGQVEGPSRGAMPRVRQFSKGKLKMRKNAEGELVEMNALTGKE